MIDAFLMLGDCVDAMASLADQSVDAICTDPPYLIGFMGKDFDEQGGAHLNPLQAQEWHKRWATEAHRVLKPGGHLLAFGGTRTYHRLAAGIEDAGFEIRDCLAWMYGTGFPKSHDVSRSIDARLGAERTDGARTWHGGHRGGGIVRDEDGEGTATRTIYETPATEEAAPWCGWGTALKPAWESVIVAVKPEDGGTVYANLCQLSNRLLTLLSAKDAAANFECPSTAYDEAFASARWDADELCSTRDALSAATATSQFGSVIASSLNIVSSWLDILADLLSDPSTSITSTGSSTTTVLRILNSCLSELTPLSIIQAVTNPPGSTSVVARADDAFAAAALSTQVTRTLSVLARATGQVPISRLGEDAPACSPVVVARKPLSGTVAATVLAHGTGALNIDACRVGTGYDLAGRWPANVMLGHHPDCVEVGERQVRGTGHTPSSRPSSAFAANAQAEEVERSWRQETVPDFDCHPDCPVRLLDEQSGATGAGGPASGPTFEGRVDTWSGRWYGRDEPSPFYADQGGASRFFYTSKAARAERNAGLEGFEERPLNWSSGDENPGSFQSEGTNRLAPNSHPTVKPVAVMRWLVRLVAPRGSVILDPFLGSGTTGIACALEGMRFVGIERDPDYMRIATARIGFWREHGEDALRIVAERDAGDRARHARTDAGQLDLFTEGAST